MTFIARYCALVNPTTGEINTLVYPPNADDYIEGEGINGDIIKWCENDGITCQGHYYNHSTSEFVEKGAQPSRFHYWDWDHKVWTNNTVDLFAAIRVHRNGLLLECDWTQLADSPLTEEDKANWVLYRDQLRNFPDWNSGATDWDSLVWPVPPNLWGQE